MSQVPSALLSQIFGCLHVFEFLRCRLVCARWSTVRIILDHLELQCLSARKARGLVSVVLPRQVRSLGLACGPLEPLEEDLRAFSQVRSLYVNTTTSMSRVATLWPALQELVMLCDLVGPDQDLRWCRSFPELESLCLDCCIARDLGALQGASLHTLNIENCRVSKAGSVALGTLLNLVNLQMGRNRKLDDQVMASLAPLKALRCLRINGLPHVTDLGVAALAVLPVLDELDLSESRVSGATLDQLQSLTRLCLSDCPMVRCDLRLPSDLVRLDLSWSTNVTMASAERPKPNLRLLLMSGYFKPGILECFRKSAPLLEQFELSKF